MVGHDRKDVGPGLPPDAQARIGAQLRRMYDDVVQEPVPDRFTALLDQLESGSGAGEGAGEEPGATRQGDLLPRSR